MNIQTLVSYVDVKTYKGIATIEDADDARLRSLCQRASALWGRATRRTFLPEQATLYHDYANADRLWLRRELLALTALTNGDGATLVENTDIALMPLQGPPYRWIDVLTNGGNNFSYSGTPQRALQVAGVWGWHDDYANAWVSSADALAAAVTSTTATTLTVANASGADALGVAPRFKPDMLIKVDTEYCWITATVSGVLTVIRGVNGTTAATHLISAPISTYQVPYDVQLAVMRWAAYLYDQKDTGVYETSVIPDMGVVTVPQGIPKDVARVIPLFIDRSR